MSGTATWKLLALFVAVGAIAHEYVVAALAAGDPTYAAFYRMALMTVAGTALALVMLPPRRSLYFLAFLACAGLMAYAFYLQYVVGLEPCPLCFFQRLAVVAMGFAFLVAAVHNPGRAWAWFYAVVVTAIGATGAALAARHVWVQNQAPGKVAECGMGIEYMLDTLPFLDVVKRVLAGSGECAAKDWDFLGLTIPGWTFVFFVALSFAAIAVAGRRTRDALRRRGD